MSRFIKHDAARLAGCAALSPRIAQLAVSFPLLFSQLANLYGPERRRRNAIQAAVEGRALTDVAEAMGLPYSLRHVPPEACPVRLPFHVWTPAASRCLRPSLPKTPDIIHLWLEIVFFAARLGSEDIALWIAKQQPIYEPDCRTAIDVLPLVLYAHVSKHQPEILGTFARWTPKVSALRAAVMCERWLGYLTRLVQFGPTGVADPWITAKTLGNYTIVPLTTMQAIAAEAHAMQNCLMDYALHVADDRCRLFSLRQGRARIATFEVMVDKTQSKLELRQCETYDGYDLPNDVLQMLSAFVAAQPVPQPIERPDRAVTTRRHFEALFQSWRDGRPESERDWLAEISLDDLMTDIGDLRHMLEFIAELPPNQPNAQRHRLMRLVRRRNSAARSALQRLADAPIEIGAASRASSVET
jgi:hypothetical protein